MAISLPACGLGGAGSSADDDNSAVQIRRMLATRAEKLDGGDVAGYLAPLGPSARASEVSIAQGAVSAPIDDPEFVLRKSTISPTASKVSGVSVDLVYKYDDLATDNVFRIPLNYGLEKAGSSWTVTTSALDPSGTLPMWATGQVATQKSEHFVALFRPPLPNAGRFLQEAERARERLQGRLTLALEPKQLILFAKTSDEYLQMTTRLAPASAIAQAETSFEVTPTSIRVQGRQIIVNLARLTQGGSNEEVFQHELGHLALAPDTRPFTPAWVGEAAAMYLADTRPVNTWRSGTRQRAFEIITFARLDRATSLGAHDVTGEAASYEYAYAAGAVGYLTETYGIEKFWEFYRSYAAVSPKEFYSRLPGGGRVVAGNDDAVVALAVETTARSLRRIFGLDHTQLDIQVRNWIAKQ